MPVRPVLFWSVAATVTAVAAAVAAQLPGAFLLHTTGARLLLGLALGIAAATVAVRLAPPRHPLTAAMGD
ncbi:hypothetical protein [Catellatospora methionotrophica]|uniref:hypothetical protein n=1 Tax=Catellatospora methionotrophica TaxID=121620 RepID=UPI0033F6FB11